MLPELSAIKPCQINLDLKTKLKTCGTKQRTYLIINALETLGFLIYQLYDPDTGNWYIETSSTTLPRAVITQTGEIYPIEWVQNYDGD
ncbi:hypothetical protein Ple7327_0678 [Pleurocapsa sp. PCC 7327]|uniref:hypothetical protein n=1 Tax=Pleurocapsa sp. PCC 7327 TaxID=118163 RepID=UPI00029FFECA|nr:hypothetical protein [Pleurocapsa sp. PCC 7327]AFY76110.1 hypothetical protein Ple7327_0678 [Pleurocapsa sp. PCC 7327]